MPFTGYRPTTTLTDDERLQQVFRDAYSKLTDDERAPLDAARKQLERIKHLGPHQSLEIIGKLGKFLAERQINGR